MNLLAVIVALVERPVLGVPIESGFPHVRPPELAALPSGSYQVRVESQAGSEPLDFIFPFTSNLKPESGDFPMPTSPELVMVILTLLPPVLNVIPVVVR